MLRASGELDGKIALAGNHAGSRVSMIANPNQVKQVFWNLAKNAVKAMPGGGTLRIDLLDEGDGVRIVFADTGVGMTEKDKEHLFEPFYSGFNDGRGLGLSGNPAGGRRLRRRDPGPLGAGPGDRNHHHAPEKSPAADCPRRTVEELKWKTY